MAEITKEDFFNFVDNLTTIQMADLIKEMEERYGVSAAMMAGPAMMAAPGADGAGEVEEQEEQTEFSVILTGYGDKKIAVLKEVRAITGLGLKEAKELVEGVPQPIKEAVSKEDAEKFKEQIEKAGGSIEIK